ncbi:MAG: MFS transporter [Planctomycetota bacterium]
MPWRRTLLSAWVAQVVSIAGFFLVMPFLPLFIRKELGVTDPQAVRLWAGVLGAAPGLMLTIMQPIWGVLSDRHGRKPMVLRAMFAGAAVLALMGLVRNVYELLALRLLQGAITGTIGASVAMVASVTPREKAGFSMGLMQAAVSVGVCIGALAGGLAATAFGYRPSFFIGAGLVLIAGCLVLFFAYEKFEREDPNAAGPKESLKDVLSIPGFPALVLLPFVINFAGSILSPIVPLFVDELLHGGIGAEKHTGAIFFVRGVALAVAAASAGIISDRLGRARVILVGLACGALFCVPQGLVRSIWPLYVWQALLGLAMGGVMPAINAGVSRLIPRRLQGRAYGLLYSLGSFGFTVGPFVGGAASALTNLRVPFFLGGAVLAAAFPIVLRRSRSLSEGEETPPAVP